MTVSTQSGLFAPPDIVGGANPLRTGWDTCTLEIVPLPLADDAPTVDETAPLRLASGVRLRRECFGSIIQLGSLGYLLNNRASAVIERLTNPLSPKGILKDVGTPSMVDLQQFLSSCLMARLIEVAPDEAATGARLYGARKDESYRFLQKSTSGRD